MAIIRTLITNPLNTHLKSHDEQSEEIYKSLIPPKETGVLQTLSGVQPPSSFNGRTVWGSWLSPIQDQKTCGGCYAFASTSALSDRFAIQSNGQLQPVLSAAPVVICNLQNFEQDTVRSKDVSRVSKIVHQLYGCRGNTLAEAWRFLFTVGTQTQHCIPNSVLFENKSCKQVMSRSFDLCVNKTPARFYRAIHIFAFGGEEQMKDHIYQFGPITTAMEVYSDFYTFNPLTEIYQPQSNDRISGHGIVIDGWGTDKGIPFWWARNSWGVEWGDRGYFRIRRGQNTCKIEENALSGMPDLFFHPSIARSLFSGWISQETEQDWHNRRTITSGYVPFGGIDQQTGISRRVLSYSDNDALAHPFHIPPFRTIAGETHPIYWNRIILVLLLIVILLLGYIRVSHRP